MVACCAFSAYGGTIDFETGAFDANAGASTTGDGFTFAVGTGPNGSGSFIAGVNGSNCTPCIPDGTQALAVFNGATVTISQLSADPFSLTSFDLAGTFPGSPRNVTSFEVIGNLAGGGTVTDTITPVDPSTFTTYTLPSAFTNLSSAEFLGLTQGDITNGPGPEFQLDNIVYGSGAPAPEPVSSVLMLAGLGGLVARARMSQRKREQTLA
jgi:hypothetical protein